MKKVKKFLMALLPSFFVLGMCLPAFLENSKKEDPGLDTAIYDEDLGNARFSRPDIKYAPGDDDDDEDEVVEVDKVVLHYYNEAGGCAGRAFYLWVTGEDGMEYNLDNASDIMSVNADGTMMTINLDFINDARFAAFKGKSSLFFIIKFKKISETNLNWGGQSDDMQLRYVEFPPQGGDKVCEVWTMPAAGGGIAILDSEAKTKVHGVKLAKFTDWKTISCELTENTRTVNWKLYAFDETYYKIKPKKRADAQRWYLVKEGSNSGNFNISLPYDAHINLVYTLVSHDPDSDTDPDMKELNKTAIVGFDKLYETAKFHTYYEDKDASGNAKVMDLGMKYEKVSDTKEQVTFKVWSPVSANLTALIYESDTSAEFGGEDSYKGYHMHYTSGGIWELTIEGEIKTENGKEVHDLKGKYYNFQVDNTLGTNVVMDPYATSAGCCGVRGYIYDKAESNPEGWDNLPLKWDGTANYDLATPQDLTIYEVHVQDFTGDSSWVSNNGNKNGTYNAFVESGTKLAGTNVTTGYDHLNELGVGAVQLVPVFDHDNDESGACDENGNPTQQVKYNWGYNPLNYNVVEGGYSSNPHDGMARVKEFKNLILQMSKTDAHTRVIMDVVYNHVSSATGSCFHKLMPRYYFRYTPEGELYDGSGCHNEVASERPMMRKFIVDSLKMWATEYKIKGFRFDLMGLIDYKTMNEVQKALYQIDPDIYIYGEGWSLGYNGSTDDNYGTETWHVYNKCNSSIVGPNAVYLGGFNDTFRNAVRGENSAWGQEKAYPQAGFVQSGNWKNGNLDTETLRKISEGLWGVHTDKGHYPEQTVNYVSCHDNWTVRDQLMNTLMKPDENHHASLENILRASLQAHGLVMASNAAAFILGGEEFLRTKEYTVDPDTITGVTADSWTEMWGHKISHNSYNAPLSLNSFKWGNKVQVELDGETITNDVYHYNEKFQDLVKMHKGLAKKRGTATFEELVATTTDGRAVGGLYWGRNGQSDVSNAVAFQANETFIYLVAGGFGDNDYIGSGDNPADWTEKFEYGIHSYSDNKVKFGNYNTIWILDRHGH